MDYRNFTVEDFAADEFFIRWVLTDDLEAEQFWSVFVLTHPDMEHVIEQARILVQNIRTSESRHIPSNIDKLWERIDATTRVEHVRIPRWKLINAMAALILVVFVAGAFFLVREFRGLRSLKDPYILASDGFIEYINNTDKPVQIHLSDSSVVEVESRGKIKYRSSYTGMATREVILSGSAFFQISKKPDQPFIVRSNEVVTEVLGTSFHVHAPQNEKQVVVSVKTGKVSVYAAGENVAQMKSEGVVLLPNQEVLFVREQQSFTKKLAEDPIVIQQELKTFDFNFENTPVAEVFRRLEDAYGIEIIFDEENISNCFLTAPLGEEPLFQKLQIICETIGGKYEVIDAKIVIGGPGC